MTDSQVGKLKAGQVVHVDLFTSCTEVTINTTPRQVLNKFVCWAGRGKLTMRIAFDTPGLHLPGDATCERAPSPGAPSKGRR